MLNRRGFLSSLAGVVAWAKSPKIAILPLVGNNGKLWNSPAASAIQPTCCACGADWHVASGCPVNITAMDGVAVVRFDGGTEYRAAAFLELNAPGVRWAEWGGQCVLPIIGRNGVKAGSFVAYAIPRNPKRYPERYYDYRWPDPKDAHVVVRMS